MTTDAVVQIGSGFWLHVPVGKLHTDRYIPLHPQLEGPARRMVGATSPTGCGPNLIFVEQGPGLCRSRVWTPRSPKAARTAGIGPVSPHQLRHTLATQAINRGMCLEAIAALLGHRSLQMTLVYARIADRTVAEEYFSVSEQVEALYDAPKQLPAQAEGSEMRQLRPAAPTDAGQRLLRPAGRTRRPLRVDLRVVHLLRQTTFEFAPILTSQRDDAAGKGQLGRRKGSSTDYWPASRRTPLDPHDKPPRG